MKIEKYGFDFDLPDEWIREADFKPFGYIGYYRPKSDYDCFIINIVDIFPKIRSERVPIFNNGPVDNVIKTSRERTVSILKAIAERLPMPPIEVLPRKNIGNYLYTVRHGCHRLHCSIAAGFSKIPAVYGFDIDNHDAS